MKTNLLIILIIFASSASSAEELGRLFFTPAQRQEPSSAKKIVPPAKAEIHHADNSSAAPISLTLNGLIQRSDGRRFVWLNGQLQPPDSAGQLNQITLPNGQSIELKVGQRWRGNLAPAASAVLP